MQPENMKITEAEISAAISSGELYPIGTLLTSSIDDPSLTALLVVKYEPNHGGFNNKLDNINVIVLASDGGCDLWRANILKKYCTIIALPFEHSNWSLFNIREF
jgi:hypothetical protein